MGRTSLTQKTNKTSASKAAPQSRYASKYVNEVMIRLIEKKLNTCPKKHKSTVCSTVWSYILFVSFCFYSFMHCKLYSYF